MPTLALFFGITVRMYYEDHAPPHFHAYYGGDSAQIVIETLEVLAGQLPRRALADPMIAASLNGADQFQAAGAR